MALSFLSSVPSSLPLLPPQTALSPASAFPSHTVRVRCAQIKTDANNEDRFSRRDVLQGFGGTLVLGLMVNSDLIVEPACAADLIQRRQRSDFLSSIKGTLFTAIKKNPDIVPSLLTVALNDAVTYDKATKSGGPNGSIRFSSEISRPENEKLSAALSLLEEAKKEIDSYSKGGPISYADLIQLAVL